MYYRLAGKVGIHFEQAFEDKYGAQMMDVLAEAVTEKEFSQCTSSLSVYTIDKLETEGYLSDGDNYYDARTFIDPKLGVVIRKEAENAFSIGANQDCPEWFMCMLEIVLLKSGITFAHCAALEKDGQALFLPARGGVGKTATVVKMIREHGWKLLCDDLLLLDGESACAYGYHKMFVIYGYHQNLFPELFAERRSPVKNDALNHAMTKMIPTAKKVLRLVPGLLAYAREHNPQQMRVYPRDIFRPEQLSFKADKIRKTMWLERTAGDTVSIQNCTEEEIASRCAAITMSELTYGSMNLNDCLFTMCGSGMLDYNEIYNRIYQIVLKCVHDTNPSVLGVPQRVPVDNVYESVVLHSGVVEKQT